MSRIGAGAKNWIENLNQFWHIRKIGIISDGESQIRGWMMFPIFWDRVSENLCQRAEELPAGAGRNRKFFRPVTETGQFLWLVRLLEKKMQVNK